MARAVSNKNANPLKFFGLINGKFFTVQLNPDLIIDTLAFGPKPMRSMQDFRYWVVANSPLPRIPRNINWQVITQEPQ
jgi:hypothetical protein